MAKSNDSTDLVTVMLVTDDTSTALRGHRVCFTGHMGVTRKEMMQIIKNHGGEPHDDIKWDTTILVCNYDWNKGSTITPKKSSKLLKAEAQPHRTKVMSEKDFLEMVFERQKAEKATSKAS